ncbi:chromate reductase [Rhizobium sp. BK226]|uniref:NADPH-dependent FMN reductase n=1 Tax=Rhizobium sp. BK226 TaxID=2587075 RepID=UPI0017AFDCD1|nr:NADPH-dependent FMN reductase [Rhizobium sp. BK226]MBB4116461.1 chromate reductase [Rhizobium sp. BK226]
MLRVIGFAERGAPTSFGRNLLITDDSSPFEEEVDRMTIERPVNLVVLLGSLRSGSFHRALAKALPELAPAGVTITLLGSVGDIPHYNADVQAEAFPGAVNDMAGAIAAADGVVVVTPEYNYSLPGVLKNALDWLSRLPSTPFAGKPVSIMSGSPGPIAGARAQYHLRQIMVFLDAIVFTKPEVMIGAINTKVDINAGTVTDEATRKFIADHLQAFVQFVDRLSPKS